MGEWLSQRSFNEILGLIVVIGFSVAFIARAFRGRD